MSTFISLVLGDRNLVVKSSVDGIGWNDPHRKKLERTARYEFQNTRIYQQGFFLKKYGFHWLINQEAELALDSSLTIRLAFVLAQQSAIIEGTRIYTAYANNVHLRFGQHLRPILRRGLSAQCMDDDETKHRIRQDIILPAQAFKQAISQQPINMEQLPQ
ncbi:hypothetical protein CU097_003249 [Rhizopus azygosporus]|uniref:Uncharacterized protein n=1 Tax=Rhizopus azygosporus TaxID=86630 RepID=A0A367JIW7_RHIAZ|nr:hypothetical protein CU097_003249 [Rhizopus azygosporus]